MKTVTLGKTNITVSKNSFGCLPIQRADRDEASRILRRAYEAGINYYDTARAYTDSEEKLGAALSDVRDKIIISTKSMTVTGEAMRKELETSLKNLRTDYIDIYQFHNPAFCPVPGGEDGLYDEALKAKKEGKIRHIGITNHRIHVAAEALESGLYETLQYPFNYLATDAEMKICEKAKEKNVGFIAMKGLSGGLLNDSAAVYAYMAQFDHVVPIWGIQKMSELEEFISYQTNPPEMDEKMQARIAKDKEELGGNFCRSCGYCTATCPAHIQIYNCARMSQLLRRAPEANWLSEKWQAEMKKIEDCVECGNCKERCPYGLDTPALLKKNYEDYKTFLK